MEYPPLRKDAVEWLINHFDDLQIRAGEANNALVVKNQLVSYLDALQNDRVVIVDENTNKVNQDNQTEDD